MLANILIRKVLIYTLGSFLTIFALAFITAKFISVDVENMGGNRFYPPYPFYNGLTDDSTYITYTISDYLDDNDIDSALDNKGYDGRVLNWNDEIEDSITFDVDIPIAGSYNIAIDYLSMTESVKPNELTIYINGILQSNAAVNVRLLPLWAADQGEKVFDSYHNEVLSKHTTVDVWSTQVIRDQIFLEETPVAFELNAGTNTILFVKEQGDFLLGNIRFIPVDTLVTYEQYHSNFSSSPMGTAFLTLEAEEYTFKNLISILPGIEKSPSVSPFYAKENHLNIIANSFSDIGGQLTYGFEVEESGCYYISIKYRNNLYTNRASFRNIYIDNEILFQELASYQFDFASDWTIETLGGTEHPYRIYLTEGLHFLTIEADASEFAQEYSRMIEIIDEISDYSLQVKKLTGGESDTNREWDIATFLPETEALLAGWDQDLRSIYRQMDLFKSNPKRSTELHKQMELVLQKLDELREDVNEIPHKMNLLSEGTNSMAQLMSLISAQFLEQPLAMDTIFIHNETADIPKANAGFVKELIADLQVYARSSRLDIEEDYDIDVWVNRSRYYINLMQQLADIYFTPESGIKVRFSVMPNESKLILANAANTQPDLALGVSGWLPYEIGLRGAAADMSQFEGFSEVISNFMPGSLIHMVHDNKVYGLPETQDFYVTFYRKDIFEAMDIEVPDTYDGIIDILPKLQRLGMNYYLPLSADTALKGFAMTAPFIYQFGATYYTADGWHAAIDSKEALEGINMMVDLYTVYSLPLQTPNFYNSFREGTLPIGVSTFNTYVQLLFAAPEISNKWDIALAPGVMRGEDDYVYRDTVGTAQAAVIFEKSDKQTEAWELLKWWMSTEIQTQFTHDLLVTFGEGFLWNSANYHAFSELPFKDEHMDIILEQLTHLHEVPKIPGGYKMERELSNVWNRVVFDGIDVRSAVDDAIVIINRELERKYAEFGYLDNDGNILKEYIMPTKEQIMEWQNVPSD